MRNPTMDNTPTGEDLGKCQYMYSDVSDMNELNHPNV